MTTTTKRKKESVKDKPALHVTGGGVRIPIWKNQGEDGAYYRAGQPELRYKGRDGEWHTAKSYGPRDLVNLIKVAALAHTELLRLNRADKPAEPAAQTEAVEDAA